MIAKVIGVFFLAFYICLAIFMALFLGLAAHGAVLLILKYFEIDLT